MHIWKWGHGQSSKSSWGDSPSKSLKETLKIVQNLIANEQWQKKKNYTPASEQIIATTMAQFSVDFSNTVGAVF